jgi:hypothetical protein
MRGAAALVIWNSDLDAELMRLRNRGLTFGQISSRMGITRSAAVGRFHRLSGKVFPSQVARRREEAEDARRRLAERLEKQRRLAKKLGADLAAGKNRDGAIKEAYEAGATVRTIAEVVGLTFARVQQITAAMGAKR